MNFFDFNRYLQEFAIPAVIAVVPALSATVRAWARRDVPVARHWMIPFAGPYAAPDDASLPLDRLGPRISTRLLRELVDLGRISIPAGHAPNPIIVARMCDAR